MLNKRSLNILEYFNLHDGNGGLKEMAAYTKSTERSLRYEIEKIDEFLKLHKIGEISKISKGVFKIENNEEFRKYLVNNFFDVFFNEYRDVFILINIAFYGHFNISKVCEEVDLSRTTIKNSLQDIKDELSIFNLDLISLPKVGLKLIGKEEDIRALQLKVLNTYHNTNSENIESLSISNYLASIYSDLDLSSIDTFIKYVIWNLKKVISDEAYSILKNIITITIYRIKLGNTLDDSPNQNFLAATKEFLAIKRSLSILEERFNININKYEAYKLTDYILGSHSYNVNMSYYENWIEIKVLIQKIIVSFNKDLDFDISKDEELLNGLINHIKPAIHRVKNKILLQNTIYDDVITEYPNLFKSTKKAIFHLEEFIESEFNNEEVAFLVLHFKGAIDRNKYQLKEPKNLLLVCGEGFGTSKLLAQQITENYDVNIIGPHPLNQLNLPIKKEETDLIITTLDETKFDTDIPVIKVRTIMTPAEFGKLEKYNLPKYNKKIFLSNIIESIEKGAKITNKKVLFEELKQCFGNKLIDDMKGTSPTLSEMLPLENIRTNISVDSWKEAIELSGEVLYLNGYVDENYGKNMVEIIEQFGPYMVASDNLAIPHAKNNNRVLKTGMSLILLDKPVYFNKDTGVNTILSFSSVDNVEHFDGLSFFLDIVNSHNFIEKIHHISSEKKIVDEIKKYEFLKTLGKH